jgi:hypothetical protein
VGNVGGYPYDLVKTYALASTSSFPAQVGCIIICSLKILIRYPSVTARNLAAGEDVPGRAGNGNHCSTSQVE